MKKVLHLVLVISIVIALVACNKNNKEEDDVPIIVDPVDPNVRKNPDYYTPGVPILEDGHVVYMNWDGFAYYYYDEFLKRTVDENAPTLKMLLEEGVFFENLRTALPSITTSAQNLIISGATSSVVKNVYRYYDAKANLVIQQARENASETIITASIKKNLPIVSVHHFLAEAHLTTTDPTRLYVYSDSTNPKVVERGSLRLQDHFSRYEQLIKVITGTPLKSSGRTITVSELPKLTLYYADDLDALGHNFQSYFGYPHAKTEAERMNNIITMLKDMDQKLGDFLQKAKDAGVYDKLTFFLTTDHGMTPYGLSSPEDSGDHGTSKLGDLRAALKRFDSTFSLELVPANQSPKTSTTVVGVGANLNIQLSFKKSMSEADLQRLKTELLKEHYVGKVHTREELIKVGYDIRDTDMIVTPADRYFFSGNLLNTLVARGQHDSSLDSADHVYGLIWGNGIKKGVVYKDLAYNYDFGLTIAAALGLELPEANGIVLDIFEQDN
jgi:predicted AlkP superfamily pyrophosphatase or phosphodiesterase